MKNLLVRLGPKAPRYYVQIMAFILIANCKCKLDTRTVKIS